MARLEAVPKAGDVDLAGDGSPATGSCGRALCREELGRQGQLRLMVLLRKKETRWRCEREKREAGKEGTGVAGLICKWFSSAEGAPVALRNLRENGARQRRSPGVSRDPGSKRAKGRSSWCGALRTGELRDERLQARGFCSPEAA